MAGEVHRCASGSMAVAAPYKCTISCCMGSSRKVKVVEKVDPDNLELRAGGFLWTCRAPTPQAGCSSPAGKAWLIALIIG